MFGVNNRMHVLQACSLKEVGIYYAVRVKYNDTIGCRASPDSVGALGEV